MGGHRKELGLNFDSAGGPRRGIQLKAGRGHQARSQPTDPEYGLTLVKAEDGLGMQAEARYPPKFTQNRTKIEPNRAPD